MPGANPSPISSCNQHHHPARDFSSNEEVRGLLHDLLSYRYPVGCAAEDCKAANAPKSMSGEVVPSRPRLYARWRTSMSLLMPSRGMRVLWMDMPAMQSVYLLSTNATPDLPPIPSANEALCLRWQIADTTKNIPTHAVGTSICAWHLKERQTTGECQEMRNAADKTCQCRRTSRLPLHSFSPLTLSSSIVLLHDGNASSKDCKTSSRAGAL